MPNVSVTAWLNVHSRSCGIQPRGEQVAEQRSGVESDRALRKSRLRSISSTVARALRHVGTAGREPAAAVLALDLDAAPERRRGALRCPSAGAGRTRRCRAQPARSRGAHGCRWTSCRNDEHVLEWAPATESSSTRIDSSTFVAACARTWGGTDDDARLVDVAEDGLTTFTAAGEVALALEGELLLLAVGDVAHERSTGHRRSA